MRERIPVRLLQDQQAPGEARGLDRQVSLPIDEAAKLIAAERAEPLIPIRDHLPDLPGAGVSLSEAFELCVDRHPDILELGGRDRPTAVFSVRDYRSPPIWTDVVNTARLLELAGLKTPRRPIHSPWMGNAPDPVSMGLAVVRVRDLEEEIRDSIAKLVRAQVVHRFVAGLAAEAWLVEGVAEGDLAALEGRVIPAGWWQRDILVRLDRNEIWERTAGKRRPGLRRWSGIRVTPREADAKAVDSEPHEPVRSGAPGRPSSMHYIEAEFDRRAEEGRIEPSIRAEAKALAAWFRDWVAEKDWRAPCPTAKTIENRLRGRYNRCKAGGRPSASPRK